MGNSNGTQNASKTENNDDNPLSSVPSQSTLSNSVEMESENEEQTPPVVKRKSLPTKSSSSSAVKSSPVRKVDATKSTTRKSPVLKSPAQRVSGSKPASLKPPGAETPTKKTTKQPSPPVKTNNTPARKILKPLRTPATEKATPSIRVGGDFKVVVDAQSPEWKANYNLNKKQEKLKRLQYHRQYQQEYRARKKQEKLSAKTSKKDSRSLKPTKKQR